MSAIGHSLVRMCVRPDSCLCGCLLVQASAWVPTWVVRFTSNLTMRRPKTSRTTTHRLGMDQTSTSGNAAGHAQPTLAQVEDEPLGSRLRTSLEVELPIKA